MRRDGKGMLVGNKGRGDVGGKSEWTITESYEEGCPEGSEYRAKGGVRRGGGGMSGVCCAETVEVREGGRG